MVHKFRYPLLLLTFGLAINLAVFVTALSASDRRVAERLDNYASAMSSLIEESVQHGLRQTSAVNGLYRASEAVTEEEFEEFAHTIGGLPVSLLGLARIIPAGELEAFLAETRITQPEFALYERTAGGRQPILPRTHYIPVHFAVSFSELIEDRGLDLAGNPDRVRTIERALESTGPALTGFVDVGGDNEKRDVELFLPIHDSANQPTVVFAVLQIGRVLDNRAPALLPPGVTWSLAETETTIGEPIRRSDQWLGTVAVMDRTFVLELKAPPDLLKSEREGHLAAFLIGLLAAALAALALHFFIQQLRSREEVASLQELTRQKDRFLSGVSHELRTPLTAVMGLLEIMAEPTDSHSETETAEFVELALQETKELADLVEDLLTAGRLSAGTLTVDAEPTDVATQVQRVIERVIIPVGKRVQIASTLGTVWADPLRLRQILRNLVTNALRYGDKTIEIQATFVGQSVSLEVRNDGPPIPIRMRDRIFEPFQTGLSQPTQPDSIGLGLSISRQLARAMGGDLTYRYTSQRSIFTITLPKTSRPSANQTPARSAAHSLP